MAFTIQREQAERGDLIYMQVVNPHTIDTMPLYGIERAAGVDDALPGYVTTPNGNRLRMKARFRTYDDDGNLCHEGDLDDDDDCTNQTAALRYSETTHGAVRIEVRRGNRWVQEIG